MQPDIGKIYEGKVTGITKFGAFVELEPGTTGMVHISEVANTFVNEIKDHLTEGQQVKVKVLAVSEDGKISLSIKKAMDPPPKRDFKRDGQSGGRRYDSNRENRSDRSEGRNDRKGGYPQQEKAPLTPEAAFEDMLNRFKQSSDERLVDIKKNMDNKRRNTARRRGN
ncbi:MAG: S1 RNA-binding domain-containing protein [Huintestinicola sp.]